MQLAVATRKGLFRFESDADRDWRIVGRDFLGEAVTAISVDPAGRRWLAALRMGHFGVKLRASDDGARSWVERDAPDGTTLAIASTTGGLWLSDDGGDRWREVTTALPPVYALRFV